MTSSKRIFLPIGAGLAGALLLAAIYFGIVSWAESPEHAVEFFLWTDGFFIPLIVGFGIQAALYTILKLRLYVPVGSIGPSGPMVGAGGSIWSATNSTIFYTPADVVYGVEMHAVHDMDSSKK